VVCRLSGIVRQRVRHYRTGSHERCPPIYPNDVGRATQDRQEGISQFCPCRRTGLRTIAGPPRSPNSAPAHPSGRSSPRACRFPACQSQNGRGIAATANGRDTGAAAAPVSRPSHTRLAPTPMASLGYTRRDFAAPSTTCSAPPRRLPPMPANGASRRDQRKTQEAASLSFSLEPFPPSRYVGRRYSPWTTRTVRHTRTNRSAMPSNCAPCWMQ